MDLHREQTIVASNFCRNSCCCIDPMDDALSLYTVVRIFTQSLRHYRRVYRGYLTVSVDVASLCFDDITAPQTDALTQNQSFEFLLACCRKSSLSIQISGQELNLALTLRVIRRMICHHNTSGASRLVIWSLSGFNTAMARGAVIEIIADSTLEHGDVDYTVRPRCAHLLAKMPQRRGCVAAPTHTGNGWHPWVIPATNNAGIDKKLQLSLTGDRIVDVQAGKFILSRPGGTGRLSINQSYNGL